MPTTHELRNIEGTTFEQLDFNVRNGAKFVIYEYAISIIVVTFKRVTSVCYVPAEGSAGPHKMTANLLSLVFGWWGLPWGPIRTIQSLITNGNGGIDVSRDVMANISKEDFENRRVVIRQVDTIFSASNNTETECFRKSLREFMDRYTDIRATYFGVFINVQKGEEPFFVVGLPAKYMGTPYTEELKSILYKSFNRQATFKFLELDKDPAITNKLKSLDLKELG
jgi:hypothetical protein